MIDQTVIVEAFVYVAMTGTFCSLIIELLDARLNRITDREIMTTSGQLK